MSNLRNLGNSLQLTWRRASRDTSESWLICYLRQIDVRGNILDRLQDHSQNILSPSVILIIKKVMVKFYILIHHKKYLKYKNATGLIQKLKFTPMKPEIKYWWSYESTPNKCSCHMYNVKGSFCTMLTVVSAGFHWLC